MLSHLGSKAQHSPRYRYVPEFLRQLREDAGLTQRALGDLLGKPHSWIYNCESGNRRVDVAEFIDWVEACDQSPDTGFLALLASMPKSRRRT